VVAFTVFGIPGPQGSKKAIPQSKIGAGGARYFTGKVSMVESSKKVKPWRAAVHEAAVDVIPAPLPGGVNVSITFYLPRPAGHFGTGRNAGTLKPSAPLYPAVKPDIDKLVRATLDALKTAGAYADDARVVDLHTAKRYADHRAPGAYVQVLAKADVRASGEFVPAASCQLAGAV
jgi:crossover junction endodeoxyribonuclease RusA